MFLMNVALFPALLTMLEYAFCVGPGSVNDQPPTDMNVWRPDLLFFKLVNRL